MLDILYPKVSANAKKRAVLGAWMGAEEKTQLYLAGYLAFGMM